MTVSQDILPEAGSAPQLPLAPARVLSLDILRFIACLLVIFRHMHTPEQARQVQHLLHRGGWIGVDLFFVLSGFLVSGLLFREVKLRGKIDVTRFLLRRGLKIYPAFYFFIATQILWSLVHGETPQLVPLLSELLFITNYVTGMFPHTWSLAVEEHFYLLIVFVIAILLRRRSSPEESQKHGSAVAHLKPLPWILTGLAAVLLVARIINASRPYSNGTHLSPTHLRLDALGIGVLLSYFWHFRREECLARFQPIWSLGLIAGIALLLPPFFWPLFSTPLIYTLGFTGLSVGSALILLACLSCKFPDNLFTRGLAYVGSHSYSIYLWHLVMLSVVPSILTRFGIIHPPIVQLASIAGCLLIGILISKLVEFPVLRWRDRWLPSRN